MNKLKIGLGMAALLCVLLAATTSASAAKSFRAKGACPAHLKEVGCFTGGEGKEQKFTIKANKKEVAFKCKKVKLGANEFFEKTTQINGVQENGGKGKLESQQKETGKAAVVKPVYEECSLIGFKVTVNMGKCLYEFLLEEGTTKGTVSVKPEKCEITIEVPELKCKVTVKGEAANEGLKEVEYKEIAVGETEVKAKVKKIAGKQNGNCQVGAESALEEGTYEGSAVVKGGELI